MKHCNGVNDFVATKVKFYPLNTALTSRYFMHVLRQPQNNYNRYTVDKEKKINAHRTKKKSGNRGRQQERSKGTITKKLQTRLKTNNKMA